jgi:hypothetical protein
MQYTFPCSFVSTARSWNGLAPVPNLGQLPALLKSRFRSARKRAILCAVPLALRAPARGWVFRLSPRLRPTGGARRDRTADPLLAKQVLSQLSYGPCADTSLRHIPLPRTAGQYTLRSDLSLGDLTLVGLGGLEPPTSPLSGVRSNRLSYRPEVGPTRSRPGGIPPNGIKPKVPTNLCGCLPQSPFCFVKGGDPAAGSPTATLLRLHPSHEPYRGKRPPHIFTDTRLSYPLLVQPTPMV